jgi:DNA-directed RNA polymerase subunit delta
MPVAISKTPEEIREMPLVELACEILKAKKEPLYFRDLMAEIQQLREMSDEEVKDVIARLYTEINIDGRFVCIGQNVWGLKRWYPVDKVTERPQTGKRFIRSSGDAFSDDDEELLDEYEEDLEHEEEATEELDELGLPLGASEDEDFDVVAADDEEDLAYPDDEEEADAELEDLGEEESEDEEED